MVDRYFDRLLGYILPNVSIPRLSNKLSSVEKRCRPEYFWCYRTMASHFVTAETINVIDLSACQIRMVRLLRMSIISHHNMNSPP